MGFLDFFKLKISVVSKLYRAKKLQKSTVQLANPSQTILFCFAATVCARKEKKQHLFDRFFVT